MILAIYGAGGLGREVYEVAQAINCQKESWSQIIFIDDGSDIKDCRKIPIYSLQNAVEKYSKENIEICVAVGEPALRKLLFEKVVALGIKLATLIHPDVSIPESTIIGDGSIVCKYVSITCDITIGRNVYIHPMACIGHDSNIGDNSVISSFVDVAGNCNVGRNVFLAIGVVMKESISIGDKSIIGMSSVIHGDVPEAVIAMGNPARAMKRNDRERVFK
jgi:sugar O-acyltransferase (sialic acid O-acetyltransferase NeuD family)